MSEAVAAKPIITANQVTFARIFTMPLVVWLFTQGHAAQWWAFGIAALVSMTDFVDGYLARKYGPTVLGGLMDPVADKVFVAVVFLPPAYLGWLPPWTIGLVFARELLITGLRTAYERRGIRFKTSYLAKVKTWVQMQGIATIIFLVLAESRDVHWTVMLSGTGLALVAAVVSYVVRKKVWRGSIIMFGCFVLLDLLLLPSDTRDTIYLMCLGIVGITWASGIDYLVSGVRQLAGRGDLDAADLSRIAGAIAMPIVIYGGLDVGAPMWVLVAVLSLELAAGGLDNLLAHHGAHSSAAVWALRSLGSSALLAVVWWAGHTGRTNLMEPLSYAAAALALLGTISEFWRGRDYYLDARLRDKKA